MNETYNNLISYSPAPEALEQIQVITADSPTDYGNVNGAGVVASEERHQPVPRHGLRLCAGLPAGCKQLWARAVDAGGSH